MLEGKSLLRVVLQAGQVDRTEGAWKEYIITHTTITFYFYLPIIG